MFNGKLQVLCASAALVLGAGVYSAGSAAQPTSCDVDGDTSIEYGAEILCGIEFEGDSDVYRFTAKAGDTALVTMTPTSGPIDPCLELYEDGNPTPINSNCPGAGGAASMTTVITANGLYTILAEDDGGNELGNYSLELQCLSGLCARSLLGYTPVEPCRIVDTRFTAEGVLGARTTRGFHTYGDIASQNQAVGSPPASYPTECPFDLGEHAAVHINVTVVPQGAPGTAGNVRAFPFGSPVPDASLVNFKQDLQNIANAAIVTTNESDIATPDIAVFASQPVHLVIDVLGYFTR